MGQKSMLPVEDVIMDAVKYQRQKIEAPHLTGYSLKLSTWLLESYLLSGPIIAYTLRANKYTEKLSQTVIPDAPLFAPQFPEQADLESAVEVCEETTSPQERVEVALKCLPSSFSSSDVPFQYWRIRDYARAYRTGSTTPSDVAGRLIEAIEDSQARDPPLGLFISYDSKDIRKQAAESTRRFSEGTPLSILDGIFMAVKDEVDCLPYSTRGGTTWFHKVRDVKKDAVCVARLRECGIIFVGKTNQHELGSGTTGINPHYGSARNPHDPNRYTGGSSAGSAALVACGLCPAALGTDGGGSVRIPSALCGIVGLKATHGRISTEGVLELGWTVEVVTPMASTVEDLLLVYAAMLGSRPNDVTVSKPSLPCFPILEGSEHGKIDVAKAIGSITFGKYKEWFEDVSNPEILKACERVLEQLKEKYGVQINDVKLPELDEMRMAHVVTIGSEIAAATNTHYSSGRRCDISYEIRNTLALMRSFTSRDYVAAQRLRRRAMFYHMEAFKTVDVIVTPTTPMTAPVIPKSAAKIGESNLVLGGDLMRFVVAPNFLGFPAISVPVGYDKHGLPIGLQLIGGPWSEATLMRLAAAIENMCASEKKQPAVFYDLLQAS
ncbi:hypothetical protein GOP47_0005961 [Adiantum capillus-veneris]|uniref:Amidase domain-containing protein n=1 Tax=Adiantum capillus-veneris TaxID=13818 RepID=A0A9D4V2J9_ADICA|nr:hypothetical protein GOP47_0005961 [Adiantum capillus-veneris]